MKSKITHEDTNPQKVVTLSEISPMWNWRIKQLPIGVSLKRLRWYLELVSASKCVVGEAHGFSSAYTYSCKECGIIGEKFTFYFMIGAYTKIKKNKERFVKHWNEKHLPTQ
ncbi:MAG TPA: hypothetical protein VE089_02425 [Nitrososphaeraceae archaeon]|nr:hypothetical protein [Nitrososphaeraceae archaeon]